MRNGFWFLVLILLLNGCSSPTPQPQAEAPITATAAGGLPGSITPETWVDVRLRGVPARGTTPASLAIENLLNNAADGTHFVFTGDFLIDQQIQVTNKSNIALHCVNATFIDASSTSFSVLSIVDASGVIGSGDNRPKIRTSVNHGYRTGDVVLISGSTTVGAQVDTAYDGSASADAQCVDGVWSISVVDADEFILTQDVSDDDPPRVMVDGTTSPNSCTVKRRVTPNFKLTNCNNITIDGGIVQGQDTALELFLATKDEDASLDTTEISRFVALYGCRDCIIQNVSMSGKEQLGYFYQCFRCTTRSCRVQGILDHRLTQELVAADPDKFTILSTYICTIIDGANCLFEDIKGQDCAGACVQGTDNQIPNQHTYSHNHVEFIGDNGIYISSGSNCIVDGNIFKNAKNHGGCTIKARGYGHQIVNNIGENMYQGVNAEGTMSPTLLDDTWGSGASGQLIAHNTFRNMRRNGVWVSNNKSLYPRDLEISHNRFYNCNMDRFGHSISPNQGAAILLAAGWRYKLLDNLIDDSASGGILDIAASTDTNEDRSWYVTQVNTSDAGSTQNSFRLQTAKGDLLTVSSGFFTAPSNEVDPKLTSGYPVRIGTSGSAPGGITAGNLYYAQVTSGGLVRLYTNAADATTDSTVAPALEIDITSAGTGSIWLTPVTVVLTLAHPQHNLGVPTTLIIEDTSASYLNGSSTEVLIVDKDHLTTNAYFQGTGSGGFWKCQRNEYAVSIGRLDDPLTDFRNNVDVYHSGHEIRGNTIIGSKQGFYLAGVSNSVFENNVGINLVDGKPSTLFILEESLNNKFIKNRVEPQGTYLAFADNSAIVNGNTFENNEGLIDLSRTRSKWTPSSSNELRVWLEAAALDNVQNSGLSTHGHGDVPATDGETVATWQDRRTNLRFGQATNSKRPTYEENEIGSGEFAITASTTGSPVTITTKIAHNLTSGDSVTITNSNSTPSLNGTYTVSSPSGTTFQITPGASITVAATKGILYKTDLDMHLIDDSKVWSRSHIFTTNDIGKVIRITNGSSWVTGTHRINDVRKFDATKIGVGAQPLITIPGFNHDFQADRVFTVTGSTTASSSSHDFSDGDAIYVHSTSTIPPALSRNTIYFANFLSSSTFSIHSTRAAAISGTGAITITGGSGTLYATPAQNQVYVRWSNCTPVITPGLYGIWGVEEDSTSNSTSFKIDVASTVTVGGTSAQITENVAKLSVSPGAASLSSQGTWSLGLPVIRFDGTDDSLLFRGELDRSNSGELFIVANRTDAGSTQAVMFSSTVGTVNDRFLKFWHRSNDTFMYDQEDNPATDYRQLTLSGTTTVTRNNRRILHVRSDGSLINMEISKKTTITGITATQPVTVTASGHGLVNGTRVVISGSNSTPSIDGTYEIFGATSTNFQITTPQNVTGAGTTGAVVGMVPQVMSGGTFLSTDNQSGTAVGGGSTYIDLALTASTSDDAYNGRYIKILSGPGAGEMKLITDYVGVTGTPRRATVDSAWSVNPTSASTYVVAGTTITTTSHNASNSGGSIGTLYITTTAPSIANGSPLTDKQLLYYRTTGSAAIQCFDLKAEASANTNPIQFFDVGSGVSFASETGDWFGSTGMYDSFPKSHSTIGASRSSNTEASFFPGDIEQVLLFDGVLDGVDGRSDRNDVYQYLLELLEL